MLCCLVRAVLFVRAGSSSTCSKKNSGPQTSLSHAHSRHKRSSDKGQVFTHFTHHPMQHSLRYPHPRTPIQALPGHNNHFYTPSRGLPPPPFTPRSSSSQTPSSFPILSCFTRQNMACRQPHSSSCLRGGPSNEHFRKFWVPSRLCHLRGGTSLRVDASRIWNSIRRLHA